MDELLPEGTPDNPQGAPTDAHAQASLTYDGWFSGWYRGAVWAVLGQMPEVAGGEAGAA